MIILQQPISFQKEIDKLNTTPGFESPAQMGIKMILEIYIYILEQTKINCDSLKKIYHDCVNEHLIRQLYFDDEFFPSGKYATLEKAIAHFLQIEDSFANETKLCLQNSYKKFDFAVKYFSCCMFLITNSKHFDINNLDHLINDFILSPFAFPLNEENLKTINNKLGSNLNSGITQRYADFYKTNEFKFLPRQIIVAEYFLRKPEEKNNSILLTSDLVKYSILDHMLNYSYNTVKTKKIILEYLLKLSESMIITQKQIIELQDKANNSWLGLNCSNADERRNVYKNTLKFQNDVHKCTTQINETNTMFWDKFKSQKDLYIDLPFDNLNMLASKLYESINQNTAKENDIFNSIQNGASGNIEKKHCKKHIEKTKKFQLGLFSYLTPTLNNLTETNTELKKAIDTLKNELESYESLRTTLREKIDSSEKPPLDNQSEEMVK